MVSTSYPETSKDWKGIFIRHLAEAIARRSEVNLSLWAPPGETHTTIQLAANEREKRFLADLMKQGGVAHLLRSRNLSSVTAPLRLLSHLRSAYKRAQVDIYHVNWLQNSLPLPPDHKPLLVSVLGTDMQLLNSRVIHSLLRRTFRVHPTIICPNADWMISPLTSLFGDIARINHIPFGIDTRWYEAGRSAAKEADKPPRWLAVSRLTSAKLGPLLEWGEKLFRDSERELHLFGPMQEKIRLPRWVNYHGPATPEELCNKWFPTSQGLITLSHHAEGRPQVMLEAMAARLPIVASRIPAHENIVSHGMTGWLCNTIDDVSNGLTTFEDWKQNQRAGNLARTWAEKHIGTWDDCAERYATLYHELIVDKPHE